MRYQAWVGNAGEAGKSVTTGWPRSSFRSRPKVAASLPAQTQRTNALAERRALRALKAGFANVVRYNEALNALEIPPNGDDYNAILDLLSGAPYQPPHVKGR